MAHANKVSGHSISNVPASGTINPLGVGSIVCPCPPFCCTSDLGAHPHTHNRPTQTRHGRPHNSKCQMHADAFFLFLCPLSLMLTFYLPSHSWHPTPSPFLFLYPGLDCAHAGMRTQADLRTQAHTSFHNIAKLILCNLEAFSYIDLTLENFFFQGAFGI